MPWGYVCFLPPWRETRPLIPAGRYRTTGEPSMEYLREMPTDEVKKELSRFKGVGPKTISCVLLFTLNRPDFPVDTHGEDSPKFQAVRSRVLPQAMRPSTGPTLPLLLSSSAVWHIAKRLGWVPNSATREATYAHLNSKLGVPDSIKYDLHVLLGECQAGMPCQQHPSHSLAWGRC